MTLSPYNIIFIIDLLNPNFPSISCGTLILRPDRKRRLKANLPFFLHIWYQKKQGDQK